MTVCFCTLAIHAPYRERARRLAIDLHPAPLIVLTDVLADFDDLTNVRASLHAPTGPMAIDYLRTPKLDGGGGGTAAYHDKRFAVLAALQFSPTAVFIDADSRVVGGELSIPQLSSPLAVRPGVPESVPSHLERYGPERKPAFDELAHILGLTSQQYLNESFWCDETLYAVTATLGGLRTFFTAWDISVKFLHDSGVYSGEGGVMGLAAARAGWEVDFKTLTQFSSLVVHEGGGPKDH